MAGEALEEVGYGKSQTQSEGAIVGSLRTQVQQIINHVRAIQVHMKITYGVYILNVRRRFMFHQTHIFDTNIALFQSKYICTTKRQVNKIYIDKIVFQN